MKKLHQSIDYNLLEQHLQKALHEEQLYKVQNDAKFRAVEQDVPTYEHFRQMVNAAHLKPLSKTDFKSKPNLSWNISYSTSNCSEKAFHTTSIENSNKTQTENVKSNAIPKTNEEFCLIWNELGSPEEKLDFLYEIRNILQSRIFVSEIPAAHLSELIRLFYLSPTKNTNTIIELLTIISKCNRFNLNLNFLSSGDTELCAFLFENLMQNVEGDLRNHVAVLSQKYGVSINENKGVD